MPSMPGAEELLAAIQADQESRDPDPAPVAESTPTPADPQVAHEDPTVSAPVVEQEDSTFTTIDLDSLPPELREVAENTRKHMEAAFTRKTQELAEQRRQFEEIGDVQTAKEAVEFYQRLQEDPDYAFGVFRTLEAGLQSAGYLDDDSLEFDDELDFGEEQPMAQAEDDDNPYQLDPRNPLVQQMRQVQADLDRIKQEREYMAAAAELDRQDRALRESHPEYGESDFDRVYQLAHSFVNDPSPLQRAAEAYEELKNSIVSSYVEQKESVPTGVTSPEPTGPAYVPQEPPKNLEEATQMGMARLLADMSE